MNEELIQSARTLEGRGTPPDPYNAPGEVQLAASGPEAVLRLYGPIGPWEGQIGAENVARELAKVEAKTLRVRIQSPGGSAAEGLAIYQQLRDWPGPLVTQVDGVAASAAALVFLAGEERQVPKSGALLMVHEAWLAMIVAGTKVKFRAATEQAVKLLEALDSEIAAMIAERSSMTQEAAAQAIEATTWYRPAEAVKAGIATGYREGKAAPGVRPGARDQILALGAPEELVRELTVETPETGGRDFLARLRAAELKKKL